MISVEMRVVKIYSLFASDAVMVQNTRKPPLLLERKNILMANFESGFCRIVSCRI